MTVTVSGEALSIARRADVDLEGPLYDTIRRVDAQIHLPRTSVAVVVEAKWVIPEIGVGGITSPRTGKVTISLAPRSPVGLQSSLTTWLDLTAAHELNHAARILSGPGYGRTLMATMISEGIADRFAGSVVPDAPTPPWDKALTRAQEATAWARVQPLLYTVDQSVIGSWLFGGQDVTRWTAYTLGADIVASARGRTPQESWAALTRDDAGTILSTSGFDPAGNAK